MASSELPTSFGTFHVDSNPLFLQAFGASLNHLRQHAQQHRPTLPDLDAAARVGLEMLTRIRPGDERFHDVMMEPMSNARLERLHHDGPLLIMAPALSLLKMDEENGGIRVTPRVMHMEDALAMCFPEQGATWQQNVRIGVETILGAVAQAQPRGSLVEGEDVWVPIADMVGSMARSFFRPQPPSNREAMETLEKLYQNFGDMLSPNLRLALAQSPTGIYDMDVKFDPNISLAAILAQLSIDVRKIDQRQPIHMPDGTPSFAQIRNVGNKTVCKITVEPKEGHSFSIDLAPRSTEDTEAGDYRAGPHQSDKKTSGKLKIMGLQHTNGHFSEVGISGEPDAIIDGLVDSWKPTLVEQPVYQDLTHAVHALISAIRVELATPSGTMFDKRVANLSILGESVLAQTLSISQSWENPPDPRRVAEIIKEGMVCLCADKDFTIQVLRESGLAVMLRMVEELKVIEDLTQQDFNRTILRGPDLANMCASMFDLSKQKRPSRQTVFEFPYSANNQKDAAGAFIDSNHLRPDSDIQGDWTTLNSVPRYLTWQLEPKELRSSTGVLTPDQYWGYCEEARQSHKVAEHLILHRPDSHHLRGILSGETTPTANDGFLHAVNTSQLAPWVIDTRYAMLGPYAYTADLVQTYHGREYDDPYYAQRTAPQQSPYIVGHPLAVVRRLRNERSGQTTLALTCPLTVNPVVALAEVKRSIRSTVTRKR